MRAASLAAQLPASSRVFRAINPENEWGNAEQLLAAIEHDLRVVHWMFADHKKHFMPFPEPLSITPKQYNEKDFEIMDADELYEVLQRPREEVVE